MFLSCESRRKLNNFSYNFPIPDQIITIRKEIPDKYRSECSLKCFFERSGITFPKENNFTFNEESNSLSVIMDRQNALNMISLLASYGERTDEEVKKEIKSYSDRHIERFH